MGWGVRMGVLRPIRFWAAARGGAWYPGWVHGSCSRCPCLGHKVVRALASNEPKRVRQEFYSTSALGSRHASTTGHRSAPSSVSRGSVSRRQIPCGSISCGLISFLVALGLLLGPALLFLLQPLQICGQLRRLEQPVLRRARRAADRRPPRLSPLRWGWRDGGR